EPLTLTMTVEALIVNGSAQRGDDLFAVAQKPAAFDAVLIAARRFPTGLSIMPWGKIYAAAAFAKRNYADIARKNIFQGSWPKPKVVIDQPRPTPDLLSTAFLTDVTIPAGAMARATLYNRFN